MKRFLLELLIIGMLPLELFLIFFTPKGGKLTEKLIRKL